MENDLNNLERVSAADRLADILRTRIIQGEITSGMRITESGLTKSLNGSRNTIRESLRQLRFEGLVQHLPNKGFFVKHFTPSEIFDIYNMRRTIEIRALQESGRASNDMLYRSLNAIKEAETAIKRENWRQVGTFSLRFHQTLVAFLNCEMVNTFFKSGMAQMRLIFAMMVDEKSFQKQWIPRDREIYEFIMGGRRQKAVDALRLYLDDSEQAVIDVVRSVSDKRS